MLKKGLAAMVTTCLLVSSFAFAHVQNEYTLYDDIPYSDAKEAILSLRAAGVIPETNGANIFEPESLLTKSDLGFWAGYFQFGRNAEAALKLDTVALGLVDSTEGNATYEDVVLAFFGKDGRKLEQVKKAIGEKADETLTKEEAARFLHSLLYGDEAFLGLFERSGLLEGPTGVIEDVIATETKDGDTVYTVYEVVINGTRYTLAHHPKVLNGPTELEKWKGKQIVRSWMTFDKSVQGDMEKPSEDGGTHRMSAKGVSITFLEADDKAFETASYVPKSPTDKKKDPTTAEGKDEEKGFPVALTLGLLAVAIIGFILWKTRKR